MRMNCVNNQSTEKSMRPVRQIEREKKEQVFKYTPLALIGSFGHQTLWTRPVANNVVSAQT